MPCILVNFTAVIPSIRSPTSVQRRMPWSETRCRFVACPVAPSSVPRASASRTPAEKVRLADARGTDVSVPQCSRASGRTESGLFADAGHHQRVLVLAVAPDRLALAALVLEPA